jgi:hypothetical protein
MTDARTAMPKQDLPECHKAIPVTKGQRVMTMPVPGVMMAQEASENGYMIAHKCDMSQKFMPAFEFDSIFNLAAGDKRVQKDYELAAYRTDANIKGIVLAEDTTFSTSKGPIIAPAFSFLFADPAARDGFTLAAPEFTAFSLREKPQPVITPPTHRLGA